MVEEDNLFSTVQQHLQGGLPQYRSSADTQPRYTDSDTLPIDGSDKIKQPPKAHESQIHIPNNALVQQRDPYLHPSIPENNPIHSNPSYPHFPNDHAWAESDLELPLTKFGSTMNFAEDEADETRQLHYSMAPKSRDSLLNSHDSDLQSEFDLASPEPKGRFSWTNSDILKRRIAQRQKGIGRQSMPVVSWFLALAMVGAFIAELIIAKQTTGQAIQTRPQVQPMIGPSAEFMISFGARFVPCMRNVPGLPATNKLPCLQYTTTSNDTFTEDQLCSLSQICGLSDASHPNQSWRFVSAIAVLEEIS
ncbi:protein S-acyltransferase [Malassezia psittaci]|uniref:Protein S-acyltransferase n=1 Tax=Malassezia psittaci TaxID=1821823 RepID=A0AAF0F6U6_9BASI|nr:protein S-acyltransferase [Malassezia psittaci]